MRNLGNAFTVGLAILGLHSGMALGARWTEASTGLTGTVAGVRKLAIDRATGSTVYAHTSGNGIFRSTDGGSSWKALGTITGVLALALDPTSASTIYGGTSHGVLKSTNGGAFWNAVNAGLTSYMVSSLAIDPSNNQTLYAGNYYGGVCKSTNGGASWIAINAGMTATDVRSLVIDVLSPEQLRRLGRDAERITSRIDASAIS